MIREQVGGAAWDSWPVGAQVAVVTLEDTLAAQTRLLELAETLAGAVKPILCNGEINNVPGMQDTCLCGCDVLHDAFDAFVAAQAEHQTTGTVPCPECEATKLPCDPETKGDGCPTLAAAQGEIRRLEALLDGPARSDEEPTYPNEFADEALYRRHVALMAERDALASQLTEAQDALESLTCGCDGIIGSSACSNGLEDCGAATARRRALNMPLPHHAEQVRLERAVVGAARGVKLYPSGAVDGLGKLSLSVAALDAHYRKEQP